MIDQYRKNGLKHYEAINITSNKYHLEYRTVFDIYYFWIEPVSINNEITIGETK
jgi:peptide methionine sulfoxide reductase MsrA